MSMIESFLNSPIVLVVAGCLILIIWVQKTIAANRALHKTQQDVEAIKDSLNRIVGPTFDQMTQILEKQDNINQEMLHNQATQSQRLVDLRGEVDAIAQKQVGSHELPKLTSRSDDKNE